MFYPTRFFLLVLLLVAGGLVPPANGQAGRLVRAEVKAVTVFRDRAQLTATGRCSVEPGSTEVVVTNMPAGLDPTTVQVSATTEQEEARLVLLGVEVRTNFPSGTARHQAAYQDSLHGYETRVQELVDEKDILQKEEAALATALSQGRKDADDMEDAAEYFRTRAAAIRAKVRGIDRQLQHLQPLLEGWQRQNVGYSAPMGQLVLTLAAEQHATVELALTYVTTSAGWEPVYDLRAQAGGSGPVKLVYKAAVRQYTGTDWRSVRLTLSGGAPVVGSGAGLAQLRPEYVHLDRPRMLRAGNGYDSQALSEEEKALGSAEDDNSWGAPAGAPAPAAPPPVTAGRDGSAIHFELTNPYTVPADGRPHTVEVQQAELPATYGLSVVPKLDPTAFLTASVTGWETYNLLPGRANTYLDGTFTGAFDLDPARAEDTLRLTLGPDRNVVVQREKSSEYSRRSFLGGTVRDAVSYVVTAKNLRQAPVQLRVEEQVPVPADSRVSVEATELSGGRIDAATGRVEWQTRLQPGETRAWKLAYEIKYPKKAVMSVE